jgi:pimeloyl-ACP methyl ester carboxylesterase
MCWFSPGRLSAALIVGLVFAGLTPRSRADDNFERVKFDTVDGVEIHGTFYPGKSASKSPCVLMLHALGGSSDQEGWAELAKKLQAKDMAVLSFDFRGHGESTNVAPGFWSIDKNRSLRSYRPGKLREQISFRDFTTVTNWATLVDDIAAAKRFLDSKNDSGECNSANVAVIGAEGGGALGMMWIWDAWRRPRVSATGFIGAAGRQTTEGQDITCAVWLSITHQIGVTTKYYLPVENFLKAPVRDKVPMYFLFGEKDSRSASYAKRLCDGVLRPNAAPKLKDTGMAPIKDNKLQGRELLKPSLNTEDIIMAYIDRVLGARGKNVWIKREPTVPQPVPIHLYLR